MSRNCFGRTLETELHLADVERRARETVGTAKRPETRGKRLALAGFSLALLAGDLKADLLSYYEESQKAADRGKCRETCQFSTQRNGLRVCVHTGQRCDRERLEALAEVWGVLGEGVE